MRTVTGFMLEQDYVFHHPCATIVTGSSGSGKVSNSVLFGKSLSFNG